MAQVYKTTLTVPGGSGRDRGQTTGPTVGTPRQRRNDPMDEGESHVDQGGSDAVQSYGMQRDVALGPGFERGSTDRERVQREEPGEVESLVAAPTTPIPESEPPICAAPPWLQEPPESWYQYTPHFSRAVARLLYWGLEEEGKPLKVYSTAYQSYLQECASQGYSHPYPATLQSLAAWVSALADRGMFYKTIKINLVDARSAQDEIGASPEELEVFSHPTLQLIIDGIKYVQREKDGYK